MPSKPRVSAGWSNSIEFAVWALREDGLQVGLFDAHGPGNAQLRAVGLTEAIWLDWLRRLATQAEGTIGMHAIEIVNESEREPSVVPIRDLGIHRPVEDPGGTASRPTADSHPALACSGPTALNERLVVWYSDYRPMTLPRPTPWPQGARLTPVLNGLDRNLWIGFAYYPVPVGYLVSSSVAVCAMPNHSAGAARFTVLAQMLGLTEKGGGEPRFIGLLSS